MDPQHEPIAIVGSGCRFPGSSSSPSALWDLLQKPKVVSKDIPSERFELKGYYHPKGANHGTTNVKRAYLLDEDYRNFDAGFFNISPNEAESMDPQQRLLIETVYEAMEAGGHSIGTMRGSDTAVYVGCMSVDYNDSVMRDINSTPKYFSTGSSRAIISNRVSYFFGWHGPSMTIDTACSSSMVALHQAVTALRSGESRVAIAGGTELLLGPEQFVSESKMSLLSPTGTSRMWDADANGYARGDGIAAVILKKLSDAIADGDHIECVIRGTGVNQDGKSDGLTVPNSEAQAALIRSTYTRAGLDLNDSLNWPQFFEAHGTGTKAGDPREAAAIAACFGNRPADADPLYVGSIKTIIGHTEGTAGLAGVIKASLAIQHGIIPPNMLLNRLNPEVAQHCNGLHVPTALTPWPTLPPGVPRRASVNSFGFGGTNGHAVLEAYVPQTKPDESITRRSTPFSPFPFSAASEESLIAVLQSYSDFLKADGTTNLCDLAWTLQSRRSALPIKTTISASTTDALIAKIDAKVANAKKTPATAAGMRSGTTTPRILGVFTGQGAQWATMGAQLIKSSAFVRERLQELDESLATLPEADRPSWKIADELLTGKESSRLGEASRSQPLCTAVQVVLVDMLRSAGVKFEAVVGHSSGEIGAAYAADFINAHDAIRIAYYRGVHAKLAASPRGQKGAMMAMGASWDEAQALLDLPAFKGRAKVAAHNSAASVTLSGDADALLEAKRLLDEEKKFARMLQVDTAYHSHHMLACSKAYTDSLQACDIQINRNRDTSCSWYSSVRPGTLMEPVDELKDTYWRDNMVNAVLFAEAVRAAAKDSLNLAIEVGPHPALKGPANQNISDVRSVLPYTGVLSRGKDDVESFADALGFIWTQLGANTVNFKSYEDLVSPGPAFSLVTGIPSYPWNHGKPLLHESRVARKVRVRGAAIHQLLGTPSPYNTDLDLRWNNFLKASEISWLDGHKLQGQTVFPAAGYVAMALEAAKVMAGTRPVKLYEVQDLAIGKAIAFDDLPNFAAETLVTLTGVSADRRDGTLQTAEFAVHACPNSGTHDLELVASGTVQIVYGTPSFDTLASVALDTSNMMEVDTERFYDNLTELGYGYSGPFKGMQSMKRSLDQGSATVATYVYDNDDDEQLTFHPAPLDVAFQATMLAQSAPGDGRLWSLHVPTLIKRIRVNPELCASIPTSQTYLPLCTVLREPDSLGMCGSVDIYSEDGQGVVVQVEDLIMKPFSNGTPANDRPIFSTTAWDVEAPNTAIAIGSAMPSAEETEIAALCERLSYFYLLKLKSEVTDAQWANAASYSGLQDFVTSELSAIESGRHATVQKEWTDDKLEDLKALMDKYPENVDLKLISLVGEALPAAVTGEANILQKTQQDGALQEYVRSGLGISKYNDAVAKLVKQISFRYPTISILEIGSGPRGTTAKILETIDNKFSSYTYTDVSDDSFQAVSEQFKAHSRKMAYKVLDIDQPAAAQGFAENAHDLIIISNALHTTSTLPEALQNVRSLLKPGGYLVVLEPTSKAPIRLGTIMAALPSSQNTPSATPSAWNNVLRKSGFSGVDAITPALDSVVWPFSILVSKAVDDRINFLKKPLSVPASFVHLDELVILGNQSLETSRIAEEITELVGKFCGKISVLDALPTDDDNISSMSTFINLVDLDDPIFKDVTEEKMEGLKCMFELSANILWVTKGVRKGEPYHNASMGFGRAIGYEVPHLSLQFLDFTELGHDAARLIAEHALRLHATADWDMDGKLLWSREPELAYENGVLSVPRLLMNEDANGRINSSRRVVTKTMDASKSVVSISEATSQSVVLRADPVPLPASAGTAIQVSQSSLCALNVAPETFMFATIGTKAGSQETVVALSGENASKVSTSISVPVNVQADQTSGFLATVAAELLAESIVSNVPVNAQVLVHEAAQSPSLVSALTERAAEKDVAVVFTTTDKKSDDVASFILSPWTSKHVVKSLLSAKTTHFVDLSVTEDGQNVSLTIQDCLPASCKRIQMSDVFRLEAGLPPTSDDNLIVQTLENAVRRAATVDCTKSSSKAIPAGELPSASGPKFSATIVDWTEANALTVEVQPIIASRLFSKDKTYLLVGLTGTLGQSLCKWMVQNGAGCICLTSRKPKIEETWLAEMKKLGGTVKLFAMDVTKKQDLKRVVDEITATCPPIAGVANAAMLMHDTLFSEMSTDEMTKVLKPKIEGTKYLDELFFNTKLDFFIVFSSLTAIIGNTGQSNYTAANGYMTGLAVQRVARGVAGTSIDIGQLAGVGFIEKTSNADVIREQLNRFGFIALSESDFHQMFAEAIYSGHPDLGANALMTTGLRMAQPDDQVPVPWLNDPRLSHYVAESMEGDSKGGDQKVLSVREQLAEATTMEEAEESLKKCFAIKLGLLSAGGEVGHDVPLVELGIDSLIAVEVRSWFLKELKTDMPVLKVLGGGSVADLCKDAVNRLPESLLPSIGAEKASPPKVTDVKPAATQVAKPAQTPSPPKSPSLSEASTSSPSSGSQSPVETPATEMSRSSSITYFDKPSESASTKEQAVAAPQPAYVKSELISFAQSRFWFLRLLMEDQTTFNVNFWYRVTGNLRIGDFERAVRLVGARHESLRTCFVEDEDEPDLAHQKVLATSVLRLERKKINSFDEVATEYAELGSQPFDIASGQLLRMRLLTLSPTEHFLLYSYHHILMDGGSYQVFLNDLEAAYNRKSLGAPPRQLPEFSRTQREEYESGAMKDDVDYWRGELSDDPPVLPLFPIGLVNARVPMKTFNVNQVETRLDPALAARVKEMSKANRSTTFHTYMAAFKALLFRFTNATDLTIGVADANRNDSDIGATVGLLLNLLTLRFKFDANQPFADAVSQARVKTLEGLAHSRVPFDILLKELGVQRSSDHSPFFQAFFDYRQGTQEKQSFGNCEMELKGLHPGRTAYDITLDITDSAAGTLILVRTQQSLYDMAATQLICDTYVHLLDAFSAEPSLPLDGPSLLSEKERARALDAGRGLDIVSTWPATLPHRIQAIAQANADKVALKDGFGRVYTYAEMTARVESIAETLLAAGVQSGNRVLVFEDATADWPCSLLAIMRIGAVYVPLDLRNPAARLANVAKDCDPAVILIDHVTASEGPKVNVTGAKLINVSTIALEPSSHVPIVADANSPGAILYSSGSTGTPKGVIIKHSGLRNEIEGYTKQWGLKAEKVLQQSAYTFNHSSDQIFTGLVNGGSVYTVPWDKRGDPLSITKIMKDEGITYTKATPAEYSLWMQFGPENLKQAHDWRFAFGGGEQLTSFVTQQFANLDLPELRFFNSYGPAEISISSTKMEIFYREPPTTARIPCGYQLPNYAAYILDEKLQPVPLGMHGEIYLAGAGVSLGYLNNKELTDQHFMHNPYATPFYIEQGWTRMYRTGDIGQLHEDGALVFHNRIAGDTQIKIRGLRIELADIESNIVQTSGGALKEAVVTLREGEGEDFLVAHVVFVPNHNVSDKQAFLASLLKDLPVPQYMIPAMAIPLDNMPLTNHSKTDRKALKAMPLPQSTGTSSSSGEMTETMLQLRRVWQELLGARATQFEITPSTGFFTVGGNSLLIVRLQSRIRAVFKVTIRLFELLQSSTLAEIAQQIEQSSSVMTIDWQKETALPDLDGVASVAKTPIKSADKVVLISGAGGFLGKHVLAELVADPKVSKIHCIALREKIEGTPRELAISSPKIKIHTGDLSEAWLGLSEETFWALASEVDSILHMGAIRSFWDNYNILRQSNVTPTKQLVKMAAARHIPIHYTSTAGVVPEDANGLAGSAATSLPATDGSNGYVASRWASEQILERATDLGIPTTIHRFVPARSVSPETTASALEEILTFVDKIGLKPDFQGWSGHFEMMLAKKAASILSAGLSEDSTDAVANFHHHENDVSINLDEMLTFIEEKTGGKDMGTMPGLKWFGRMKTLGLSYFLTSQDLTVQSTAEGQTDTLETKR